MNAGKRLILIVEDDSGIRNYLAEVFQGDGFPVEAAENGRAALELLARLDPPPSLIFLDLMMPVMDGQSFLAVLRSPSVDERLGKIPVVILSAARLEVSGDVVAYVRKPPQLDQLIELAEKYAGSGAKPQA